MTNDMKRRALQEMDEDLNELEESLQRLLMDETDSDRFHKICAMACEVQDFRKLFKDVHDFLEPLYR